MPSTQRPIFVVAGQSNVNFLTTAQGVTPLAAQLNMRLGQGVAVGATVYQGGSALTFAQSGQDWSGPGELQATLQTRISGMLVADPGSYLAGIVWVQGEADTTGAGQVGQYGAALSNLIGGLETGLAGFGSRVAEFRVVVSALSAVSPMATARSDWLTLRAAQLALDHDRVTVVDPDDVISALGLSAAAAFLTDGLHYQAAAAGPLLQALIEAIPVHLTGTAGHDRLGGMGGDDRISGRSGQDHVAGGAGDDSLSGGTDHDSLNGGAGADILKGGPGADRLVGGAGADTLRGGNGSDAFIFTAADIGSGIDLVTDFRPGDTLNLRLIDASSRTFSDESFHFLGQAGFTGAGAELRWQPLATGGGSLTADLNGDRLVDWRLDLAFIATLTGAEMIL